MGFSNIHNPPNTDLAERDAIELMDTQMSYDAGYQAGLRAQFQIDCEAECTACGKPEKYLPALWVENDNTYQHEVIGTGKMEYCDATLLYMYFSDTHKDK